MINIIQKVQIFISLFFNSHQKQKIVLSGGVNFIYHSGTAQKIFDFNEDVKLILILRNPVERAYSAYNYFVKTGVEKLTFKDALRKETTRSSENYYNDSNFSYVNHGYYSKQLSEYLKIFKKENIYIGIFEEILLDKQKFINSLSGFLGVNSFSPIFSKKNESKKTKFIFINQLLFGTSRYREVVMKLVDTIIPVRIRTKIKSSVMEINTSKTKPDILDDESNDKLKSLFIDDITELEKLLNRDLSIWK